MLEFVVWYAPQLFAGCMFGLGIYLGFMLARGLHKWKKNYKRKLSRGSEAQAVMLLKQSPDPEHPSVALM